MTAMLLTVFSASLLGSLHCAGMCGPFCGVAVSGPRSRGAAAPLHAAYHGGRLLTYTLLGAAAGALGALVDLASSLAGLQPIALALAGGAMVFFGVSELARAHRWRLPGLAWRPPRAWTRLLQRGQQFAARRSGPARALTIGLLTTLLPCGWLYAFVVTAAGTGSPAGGMLVMAAFWVGTLPVLLSLGAGVRRLAGVFGHRLPTVTAIALMVVGFVTLSGRLALSPEALAETVQRDHFGAGLAAPDPTQASACCRDAEEAP